MGGSDKMIVSGGKGEQFSFVYMCQAMLHSFSLQKSA